MQAYIKLMDLKEELYENSSKLLNASNNKEKINNCNDKRGSFLNRINAFFNKISAFLNNIFFKIVVYIKRTLYIITVKEIYSGLIFILPVESKKAKKYKNEKYQNENLNKYEETQKVNQSRICKQEKQAKKCISKINKLIEKYKISSVVISEELKNNKEFIEKIFKNKDLEKQVEILSGKKLVKYLIKEIIEYILNKQTNANTTNQIVASVYDIDATKKVANKENIAKENENIIKEKKSITNKNIRDENKIIEIKNNIKNIECKTELEDLYILVNKDDIRNKENIVYLSKYFRTINIVTPLISNYQKFANNLEEGAMITVTNNKKKSLRKAKWIVNFDMALQEMKKYTIYRTATIIYIENEEIYSSNTFDGLHICKAGIDVSQEIKDFFMKEHLLNQCSLTVLYESTINTKNNYAIIKEKMKKDKVKINELYGIRGKLNDSEYQQILTNGKNKV